jgi:hypothetical protein
MRRILWFLIVGSLVFDVFCLVVSGAFQPPEGEHTPAPILLENPVLEGSHLTPEPKEHDFGIVTQKRSMEHVFLLRNTGSAPLEITSVEASCGCTSTLLSDEVLQPGQAAELKVGFQSGSMEGPFRKKVTIFTNDEDSSIEIYIKGSVQPLFTVDPAVIAFGNVSVGEQYRRKVVIQPRRNETPFELGKVRCLDPQIRIENLTPLPERRGASFEVIFMPTTDGFEQGSISYETGHPEMPRGYVRYSGRREI